MEKKDFFVSYNKENKAWAKWIAGTLEEHDYTVYLQAWDITPGDDFISKMNEFLKYSKNYIAIWSKGFSCSPYCKKEFQTAFNEHLIGNFKLFLPIRIENVAMDPLYKSTVYVDLFTLDEIQAKKALLNAVGHTVNPRKKGNFPNAPASLNRIKQGIKYEKPQYPGCLTTVSINENITANISFVRLPDGRYFSGEEGPVFSTSEEMQRFMEKLQIQSIEFTLLDKLQIVTFAFYDC